MATSIEEVPKVLNNTRHTIEPTWGEDTGRMSNNGTFSGTFIGWFDTLDIYIGETTYEEMMIIRNVFEHPTIYIEFLDSKTNSRRTTEFYGTAITAERNNNRTYKPFNFSLKAIRKRGDM